MNADVRAQFEAWARSEFLSVHRHGDSGPYSHPRTFSAWEAWKAALAARQPVGAPAQAVDLPYSLDADPAGIRARVCDAITGTLMVGAQGHTPPPAGHWAEPFWKAARADAAAQAVGLGQFRALAAKFDGLGDEEVGDAYSGPYYECARQLRALIDSKAVGND